MFAGTSNLQFIVSNLIQHLHKKISNKTHLLSFQRLVLASINEQLEGKVVLLGLLLFTNLK